MSQTIGIFGGTFNPIHIGHVTVCRAAIAALAMDRLILVPSACPPHKTAPDLACGEDRLAMCRLALADAPAVEVSDSELRRPGPSYTIETVESFRRQWPEAALLLVIGADMLRDFHLWRHFAEVARLTRIITLPRPSVEIGPLAELRQALGDQAVERILADVQQTPLVDVSSTEIRQRLSQGRPIDDLVPATVARYIVEHSLYH
jgi:nicotinate-nucleotide adenylyltransferase